jgi:hypothetical protein
MKRVVMVFCLAAAMQAWGVSISQETAVERAVEWMAGNPVMGKAARTVASVETFPETGAYSVYVVHLSPAGYLVLNSDDRLPLVVSFSAESTVDLSDVPQNAFRAMLLQHVARMEEQLAQPIFMRANAADEETPMAVTELHGPFLETTWNQCTPYNKFCPDDPGGSEYYGFRVPVGCTPAAYAQVLQYHRWPLFGEGTHSYTDSAGGTTGSHIADFSDAYDWRETLLAYDPWGSNSSAAGDAVAELMYELGVAAEANYESSGTSSSIQTLGQRLGSHYFFESCDSHFSPSGLIAPMEADLRAGFPCVVAIPGHAIVADGLMVDSGSTTYHINYGWGGTNNGWWDANGIPGGALQYGVTGLRPQLLAFPLAAEVSGIVGEPLEVQWILPKRRESEAGRLVIHRYNEQLSSWEPITIDDTLASRRFSEIGSTWDDCNDFSMLEVTSSSTYKDWMCAATGGVDSCFYKPPGGYSNRKYHLTSLSTITPSASSRLLLRVKYNLAGDRFRILVSTDGSVFSEIWSGAGSIDWSDLSVGLVDYAGQAIYVRLEYAAGSYYSEGGIWIDSIKTQKVTNPELEGQPVHYTVLPNLPGGTYTLAASLIDTSLNEHELGPAFTLTMDDGDGMPSEWEERYGLDPGINDGDLDPDHDGYGNLEEYICGTDPTNIASCWMLESGDGILPVFYAMEERTYTILYRTNLTSGTWVPLVTDIPGSNHVVTVEDYDAATNAVRFYCVEVQLEN